MAFLRFFHEFSQNQGLFLLERGLTFVGTIAANKQDDMANQGLEKVVGHLRRDAMLREEAGWTDGRLLNAFIENRDDVAFEALMRRHGPMVYGVCRRILGHEQDAQDAF